MVTAEGNRKQATTESQFERQTQVFQESAESVAKRIKSEAEATTPLSDPFWSMSLVATEATIGSIWGLGAVVLAILGLSGVAVSYLMPITGIVLGAAFLMLGIIGIAWARMFRFSERETFGNRVVFSSGNAATLFAGLAAVILGILGLVYSAGASFSSVIVIVLGASLFWHGGLMLCLRRFFYRHAEERPPVRILTRNALFVAPIRDFVIGFGSVVLGILALLNILPVVLAFVALLAMGAAATLATSTVCGTTLAILKCKSRCANE